VDTDLRSIESARRCAERAFDAYRAFLGTDPERIDAMVQAMAQAIEPEARRLGEMAGVAAFGEPMGVVAALIPVTNPTSTIIFKVLSAVKAGNAIVCAPHPRGVECGRETVRILARAASQSGAPDGLIQCLEHVTPAGTAELMQHRRTSMVMATGGPQMVKAAYSSGKPTLAVGAGNVPCFVDSSKADELGEVADQIVTSKAFDFGTACVLHGCGNEQTRRRYLQRSRTDESRTCGSVTTTPRGARGIRRSTRDALPRGRRIFHWLGKTSVR